MEIININIVEFYKYCLDAAERRGYNWVLCLLAREADAESTYRDIMRYWDSLNDLTGREILFVFAGRQEEQVYYSSIIRSEQVRWRGFKNKLIHLPERCELSLPDYKYSHKYYVEDRYGGIVSSHTGSISELCKYFGVSERDVPSMIFTPTHHLMREKHVIVKLRKENIYEQIKEIVSALEKTLGELNQFKRDYNQKRARLNEISCQINIQKKGTKKQKRFADAKYRLQEILENSENGNTKICLLTALKNGKVSDWNIFDRETRRYLNQYVDLLNNNPNIEKECNDSLLKLKELELQSENLETSMKIHKEKIVELYEELRCQIEQSSNVSYNFVPNSEDKEKRFKVAFSFPGEHRKLVSEIAAKMANIFTEQSVLYDEFHKAELARPNLDTYLQKLYFEESEFIVVFVCSEYDVKQWCGIEWRAIRSLLNSQIADERLMFVKCGEGKVEGFFQNVDGYLDATQNSVNEIVISIMMRHESLLKR